ncbi:MAG: hypothetical protein MMC33_002161 [Icmadophila ericetorum]|nr:hypothetical protein [Icmadophila ericetorum]
MLQSLMRCETEVSEPPLDAGNVEVDVMAVDVNFKDVTITIGIVPDNEYNIGFECAGVVKQLGQGVNKYKVGDRVCMVKAGSYSVLIHSATGGVGIACIQLAQYKKAEIYVAVGIEEKCQFLESNYGIPRSRMLASRNTKFAQEIM